MFAHGSNLDPPSVMATFPTAQPVFVAKDSLFKVPLWGTVMKKTGHICIDRANLKSAIDSLGEAASRVQESKKCVAIAPEGTRRRSNSIGPDQLLDFKKGPFHLAKNAEVDIIPVSLMGAHRLWPPGQIAPNQGTVYVRYGSIIPASKIKELGDITKVQELVKKEIQNNIEIVPDEKIFHNPRLQYGFFIGVWAVYLFISYKFLRLLGISLIQRLTIRIYIYIYRAQHDPSSYSIHQ
eukprot:TRINITY_DN1671_c0_g1_i1.p2 TRINITY_DN1671_c0_g1~~TRINITY_DN1671_c0_g1_i1.p2  ORF type:complete len:237 (-),score=44.52 TRINITY_DN1671_c0_g1_i1:199-909(-)